MPSWRARKFWFACCRGRATPKGILNLALFRKLKRDGAAGGAFLINAGRGPLQVDADIVTALDDGTLAGCTLDVFPQEPLPPRKPAVEPSQGHDHAAQRRRYFAARVRRRMSSRRSSASSAGCRWIT